MKYYFAPMEGITGYVYRRVHHKYFPGVDKYFTPFISPGQKKVMTPREKRDILPENNPGYYLVPQILTNRAEDFLAAADALKEYGYTEVNLNLGCPSGTVTAKKKGSGFLAFPKELDRFLEDIFAKADMEISVKTRLGVEDAEEFQELLQIYEKYPLKELIIHARVQKDFYKNKPDLEAFQTAAEHSRHHICYNGDLFTEQACAEFQRAFPRVETCMLGRGLLVNPGLVASMTENTGLDKRLLREFHDALCEEYGKVMSGERNVLFKMKELWFYMGNLFEENKKPMKKIKKAQKLSEYMGAVDELFSACPFSIPGTRC